MGGVSLYSKGCDVRKIYITGTQYKNKCGEICTIIESRGSKSLVQFEGEFPHQKLVHNTQLQLGSFVSDFRKSVYGVGIFIPWKNYECRDSTGKISREYNYWANMLKRVYCKDSLSVYPTYKDMAVFNDWHRSDKYWEWAEKQVGWLKEGYHQDKDILVPGNKIYSPETTVFIPHQLNTFLNDCCKVRSRFGQGVSFKRGRYSVCIWDDNKYNNLGSFKSQDDAQLKFKEEKTLIGRRWGERLRNGEFEVDQRVIDRMLNFVWEPRDREGVYETSV